MGGEKEENGCSSTEVQGQCASRTKQPWAASEIAEVNLHLKCLKGLYK